MFPSILILGVRIHAITTAQTLAWVAQVIEARTAPRQLEPDPNGRWDPPDSLEDNPNGSTFRVSLELRHAFGIQAF